MHLLFFVRGIISQINQFEIFMQAQMFPWTRVNLKTGKKEIIQVQGGLRRAPWGYEYIFPKECLADVLTMLDIKPTGDETRWGLSAFKNYAFRKMLGKDYQGRKIKPIPKYIPVKFPRFIERRGVAIYPIGIKEDEEAEMRGYLQEML